MTARTVSAEGSPVGRVLVLDEAVAVRTRVLHALLTCGVPPSDVDVAGSAAAAREAVADRAPDLVFAELVGDDPRDTLALFEDLLRADPWCRLTLLTAARPDAPAVQAARALGAHVLEKPLRRADVERVVLGAQDERRALSAMR